MAGQIYEKKKFLIINAISGRGEYQVINQFREMLSYPINKWEAMTRACQDLAMRLKITKQKPNQQIENCFLQKEKPLRRKS